jgi:hypothetical protein
VLENSGVAAVAVDDAFDDAVALLERHDSWVRHMHPTRPVIS